MAIHHSAPAAQALARHSDLRTKQAYIAVTDQMRRQAVEAIADWPLLRAVGESPQQ